MDFKPHVVPVADQIERQKDLKDGWYCPHSLAPPHDKLDWLKGAYAEFMPPDVPIPFVCPREDGGITFLWESVDDKFEATLDAHLIEDVYTGTLGWIRTPDGPGGGGEGQDFPMDLIFADEGWEAMAYILRNADTIKGDPLEPLYTKQEE